MHGSQLLAEEGTKGFFKGLAAPLATVAIYNAVLFAARGNMERLLAHSDGDRAHSSFSATNLFLQLMSEML